MYVVRPTTAPGGRSQLIAHHFGEDVEVRPLPGGRRRISLAKAERLLGYQPTRSGATT